MNDNEEQNTVPKKKKVNWTAIAALAALLAAIPTLLPYFRSSEYKLNAVGEYTALSLPETYRDKLKEFRENLSKDEIETLLNEYDSPPSSKKKGKKSSLKKVSNSMLAWELSDKLRGKYPENLIDELFRTKSVWKFVIENTGNIEVTEIILEMPIEGYCKIVRNADVAATQAFKKEISIGSIRPASQVVLYAWSSEPFYITDQDRFRVVYPKGLVMVEFSSKVTGFFAWLSKNWYIPLYGFFCILALSTSFILQLYQNRQAQKTYLQEIEGAETGMLTEESPAIKKQRKKSSDLLD